MIVVSRLEGKGRRDPVMRGRAIGYTQETSALNTAMTSTRFFHFVHCDWDQRASQTLRQNLELE